MIIVMFSPRMILLANSIFVGMFYSFKAHKMVDIPHQEGKYILFWWYLSPLFEFASSIREDREPLASKLNLA